MTSTDVALFVDFYLKIGLCFFLIFNVLFLYRVSMTKTYYRPENKLGSKHENELLKQIETRIGRHKTMAIYICLQIISRIEIFITWPKFIHYFLFVKWKKNQR